MRIVAGRLGGRRLVVPGGSRVRPTADRVREAWMSILQNDLSGARVLDLYAGAVPWASRRFPVARPPPTSSTRHRLPSPPSAPTSPPWDSRR